MFQGSHVALVTPFTDDGQHIDFEAYGRLIDWQLEQGTDGIVPAGTTGEAATMTHEEQIELIRFAVDRVQGRAKVIPGTGSNNTAEALRLTRAAREAGADAALVVTPYYNKPTEAGLIDHYRALHAECDIPIVLYNVPGRTGSNVLPDTVAAIVEAVPGVVAVKEASGDVDQASGILQRCPGLCVLSGDDALTLPIMSVGGKGVISVAANVCPGLIHEMTEAALQGDFFKAAAVHHRLYPLMKGLFMETNPIPVKEAVRQLGRCGPAVRAPLSAPAGDTVSGIEKLLNELGLR